MVGMLILNFKHLHVVELYLNLLVKLITLCVYAQRAAFGSICMYIYMYVYV